MPDDDLEDDDRPTQPRIPPEPDTSPDLARLACFFCKGTKTFMRTEEWGPSRYLARRIRCTRCGPDGRVDREEFQRQREIREATDE